MPMMMMTISSSTRVNPVRFFSTFFMGFPLLYDGVFLLLPVAYNVYRSFSGGLFLGAVGRW
jgi:hypothetical protein